MSNLTRHELTAKLILGTVLVEFTKANGEVTEMTCTLSESVVPKAEHTTLEATPRSADPNLMSVWSIDRKGWRSFKLDRVSRIEVLNT